MTQQPPEHASPPSREADYFDFDAWHAETQTATIPFRLLGRTWQLPGDVEARLVLKMQRLEQWSVAYMLAEEQGEDPPPLPAGLTEDDLETLTFEGICRALAGDSVVEQWLEAGITVGMLTATAKRLWAIHADRDADEAMGLGKPQAAHRKKPQDHKPKAST